MCKRLKAKLVAGLIACVTTMCCLGACGVDNLENLDSSFSESSSSVSDSNASNDSNSSMDETVDADRIIVMEHQILEVVQLSHLKLLDLLD